MTADHSPPLSDLALMQIHARTLYTHDAAGRIIAVNEPGGGRADRFFLGRTAQGAIWRARDDLPSDLAAHLGRLIDAEPSGADLRDPPASLPAVLAALQEYGPVSNTWEDGGPCYRFPHVIGERSGATLIAPEDDRVMARWLPEWQGDVATRQPLYAVLVEGDAVAVCACARRPGEAAEAGVETHPDFRGHGYAADVTAAWARDVRARGVIPLYSTSWTNATSQRVAAKLSLVPYGASLSIA